MNALKTVVIGILGTNLDRHGNGGDRWNKWRPTISICQHDDLLIDRLELLADNHSNDLVNQITQDIEQISPETAVRHHQTNFKAPWDFESVYATLLDFARSYSFDTSRERYLIHITTGTHVAQICLYLLTEAGYLPGKLMQTSPGNKRNNSPSEYQIIDLDLSKYDQIASRFATEHKEGAAFLKSGIETKNVEFNRMIAQIEQISIRSSEPILLMGPTGAGKSQLAKRIFELRKQRGTISGKLVSVNCATLRGDNALSALFGHKKGAFTGATTDRPGLLKQANNGLLFLDEVGELGPDEQAMLLGAIEDKRFMPLGSDQEEHSDFQLIAGTNHQLADEHSRFRDDLLARIDLWTYRLPSLTQRMEDFEPNLDHELRSYAKKAGHLVSFNKSARDRYITFANSPKAIWSGNFRDLNSSIIRMATLADGGRITADLVADEIERLETKWRLKNASKAFSVLSKVCSAEQIENMDRYDQNILSGVISECLKSKSMAEAGRRLFNISRLSKRTSNDSHRIRQILEKHGLRFDTIQQTDSRADNPID